MDRSSSFSYRNPRDVITEDALTVAPQLLGLPLARPWRRGAAMAIDGILILMLSNAPGVLFGFAAALVLFRVSARPAAAEVGYLRRSVRLMFRFGGAVVLFAAAVNGWSSASERFERTLEASLAPGGTPESESPSSGPEGPVQGLAGLKLAGEILAFQQSGGAEQARTRAESAVRSLRAQGMEQDDVEEMLLGIAESEPDKPWLRAAAESALGGAPPAPAEGRASPDSVALAYAAAVAAGDPEGVAALRPALAAALAADTLAEMNAALVELRKERAALRARIDRLQDEAESQGFAAWLRRAAEELGLGVGWAGLYFTAMLALWQGRTPGKRLLGIRVIRLNGKPIGWWIAFERFGGYAAGLATGLLGFFQILWDRNRQAIHDKITETAVIRG